MKICAATLVEVDWLCDYMPIISTFSNALVMLQKCLLKFLSKDLLKGRYWAHIEHKKMSRCAILLVPFIGNGYVIYNDYRTYKKEKVRRNAELQAQRCAQRYYANMLASMLATLSKQVSGVDVSVKDMMPAPSIEQQRLWTGCRHNDVACVRELLQAGISPNFYHAGCTPLVTACQYGSAELVKLLIDRGACVDMPDRFWNIPISAACNKGNLQMVQVLQPHIQDMNIGNSNGVTPLMFAVVGGHFDVVEFLLQEGADPFITDKGGESALIYACKKGLQDVVASIQQRYADRITGEIQERMLQASKAREGVLEEKLSQKNDPLTLAIDSMAATQSLMKSIEEQKNNAMKEQEALGPVPRTGMEILLGYK